MFTIVSLLPDAGLRLREIRLRALREAPDAFGTTLAEAEAWPLERWATRLASTMTFVAVLGGADVGLVGATPDNDSEVAWLISMWVAPEARRHGVGSALIDALIDWAETAASRIYGWMSAITTQRPSRFIRERASSPTAFAAHSRLRASTSVSTNGSFSYCELTVSRINARTDEDRGCLKQLHLSTRASSAAPPNRD